MVNSHPTEPIFCLHSGPGQPGGRFDSMVSEWFTAANPLLECNLTGSLLSWWISRGCANQLRPVAVVLLVIVNLVCPAVGCTESRRPRRGSPHGLSTWGPSTNEELWVKSCWGVEGRVWFFFSFSIMVMFLSLKDYKKGPVFQLDICSISFPHGHHSFFPDI